eukprot:gnl/Trimastix_PCT/3862.p1 GENE.gnl/Trimastix_PCT/3862~~gnl/Trimastix_PCT/3862.p1  ORF type:complete len:592 (-),score=77.98 gnl/Trimastix_PCT/3862:202-1977(-)
MDPAKQEAILMMHLFLQRPVLSEDEMRELNIVPTAQKVRIVNEFLEKMSFKISEPFLMHGKNYCILFNMKKDGCAEKGPPIPIHLLAQYKRILRNMVRTVRMTEPEIRYLTGLSTSNTSDFLELLLDGKWLELRGEGCRAHYTLGVRSLVELEKTLNETSEELEGRVSTCMYCQQIMLEGWKCPDCTATLDDGCYHTFFSPEHPDRACMQCGRQTKWIPITPLPPPTEEEIGGARAVNGGPARPAAPTRTVVTPRKRPVSLRRRGTETLDESDDEILTQADDLNLLDASQSLRTRRSTRRSTRLRRRVDPGSDRDDSDPESTPTTPTQTRRRSRRTMQEERAYQENSEEIGEMEMSEEEYMDDDDEGATQTSKRLRQNSTRLHTPPSRRNTPSRTTTTTTTTSTTTTTTTAAPAAPMPAPNTPLGQAAAAALQIAKERGLITGPLPTQMKAFQPPPPNATPDQIAALARQRAEMVAAQLQLSTGSRSGGQQHYSEELDINDYPQPARYRATHKETLADICEFTETAVATRGHFFPPGKQPGPGQRKLYLSIEGPTLESVRKAKGEIMRILTEETARCGASFPSHSTGRYVV